MPQNQSNPPVPAVPVEQQGQVSEEYYQSLLRVLAGKDRVFVKDVENAPVVDDEDPETQKDFKQFMVRHGKSPSNG